MNRLHLAALAFIALAGPPAFAQAVTSYPVYKEAVDLTVKIDSLDVEHKYLRDKTTGDTYCNVFAKASADKAGAPFIQGLANTQHDWLAGQKGRDAGWKEVTCLESQMLSGRGWFVLAAWKNSDPNFQGGHGHIAWVRPSTKDVVVILVNGPDISQAGYTNYKKTDVATGFGNGRAWSRDTKVARQVRFFAYRLPGSK